MGTYIEPGYYAVTPDTTIADLQQRSIDLENRRKVYVTQRMIDVLGNLCG
jgi:hypothetical protein